ncbi:endonuclease/exonuclease/phosphatase family protein [Paraburkholderia hospita]|jgi:endonuclease/exonuclease/phosphatase family metal-dependent hydrolase|uniref:Endonuclease n=1 Tax=Paraburkholderia hospita TaxID=169430 RepID=A0AAJ4SQS0_9BURK|nr:endonuclease/exonuclease/phosphatase family protein [Paraburkholderia hospita]EUC21509.1 Endonuclease/exonuclease/phosphatase [Burkholderia sp. BT03]SKC66867.1 Metal-dependent hydrolase, endonuclease/exonuclease/phosphatase family [Burkholderia sp. CF099]AUT66996.1 endonuclease [Paraburkholderia hospita]EIN00366.1 endonuclease/exonuclease/phosphatase [Paraburkholderia hospita]OUL88379.1 endonuclease [Paraburkholderia hospita]
MRNPEELIRENLDRKDFIAVSWNLHKGRSPLGFQAWQAMQRWVQSVHADAYFLQEAMARRMPGPVLASSFGARLGDVDDDVWHCQATEIADSLQLQIALGPNVFKPSWRHGNAILSPHPLDLGGRWDISAHRFERRGLLVARATFGGHAVTLLCAHLALTRQARLRQMNWIAHWISKEAPDGPLVLAGDFNDWRNDSVPLFREHGLEEVATLLGEPGRTFPAFSPALALDKMFVRGMKPVEWIQPAQETAWLSDHLPYMARLRVD